MSEISFRVGNASVTDVFRSHRHPRYPTSTWRWTDLAESARLTGMSSDTSSSSIRLNFAIDPRTQRALTDYCQSTGRTVSDLARQLITELLDGDTRLDSALIGAHDPSPPHGHRTSVMLKTALLSDLDDYAGAAGATKGAVLGILLKRFLSRDPGVAQAPSQGRDLPGEADHDDANPFRAALDQLVRAFLSPATCDTAYEGALDRACRLLDLDPDQEFPEISLGDRETANASVTDAFFDDDIDEDWN